MRLARLLHDAFALPRPLAARRGVDDGAPRDRHRDAADAVGLAAPRAVRRRDGRRARLGPASCGARTSSHSSRGRADAAAVPLQPVRPRRPAAARRRRRAHPRCEALSRAWKQRTLFLKVRADNDGAERLYARAGFESVAVREAANVPGWQERWKGETAGGLLLMRKRLGSPRSSRRPTPCSCGRARRRRRPASPSSTSPSARSPPTAIPTRGCGLAFCSPATRALPRPGVRRRRRRRRVAHVRRNPRRCGGPLGVGW